MILGVLASIALGAETDAWVQLQDALLLEQAYGDTEGAVAVFEGLARGLSLEDPVRSMALYWLGDARYRQGDAEGARTALRDAVRTPGPGRARSLDLLTDIEIDESRVRTVPTRWNFENGRHGFVHPAALAEVGSLRIDATPGDSALLWTARRADSAQPDVLYVGFGASAPRPRLVRFRVRPGAQLPVFTTELIDENGSVYLVSPESGEMLSPGRWTTVEIRLDALLDARALDRLLLRIAPAASANAGTNYELWVDDFSVE
jgi:hypothetical protein